MKAVIALALAGAAVAMPAGWQDAPAVPVESTVTTKPAVVTSTWKGQPTITTAVADESKTWEDAEVTSTTVDVSSTWADYTVTTPAAETSAEKTWVDYTAPVTETTTTLTAITTYCAKPTTFTDKGDVYTVTEATTLTLTKGPYTVTIPVYEETSTVCDKPVAPTGAASTWADAKVPTSPTATGSTWADVKVPASTGAPHATYTPKAPVSPYTGSASKMAGAGLAGVAAIAALLL